MAVLLPETALDWSSARSAMEGAAALIIIWVFVARPVYLLFLHPLSRFPGPTLWAVTRWGVSRAIISGKSHDIILALHARYGPIVRVAPDELAFQAVSAWNDIGGHRKQGEREMTKEPVFNEAFKNNLLGVQNREDHSRMRRILSRGFSASALQKQEPFIQRYVDQLMAALQGQCGGRGATINLEAWYSFTAFDVIGDLTFGESFGSLDGGGYHPWASLIFDTTRFVILANSPKGLSQRLRENEQLTDAKIAKRRALGPTRPDYMSAMLGNDEKGRVLSDAEIKSNCTALILGGAETISSALSGTTYYLTRDRDTLAKAVAEVRAAFSTEDEITTTSTNQLKYLNAAITESLRMFPPFAGVSPRQVPRGGAVIAGEFIPENTTVGIWHWSMSRCPDFFFRADEFRPERWLGDPLFANDRREAAQPFAVGPRNCIGMNLAYLELRLILARVLWNFDLELDPSCVNWVDDLVEYFGWEKTPLLVQLTPRQVEAKAEAARTVKNP
ncbi:cytochrome P450 [Niveomyces insectorum RCEF 264]|uniref:Cytochrome P450 n=1 Tax=Niveomyces insectorum RCEF 264 TaxID=1081102 RepID=A0A167TEW0_9HYPO|nr:cytochrome P450 [Niveomyces insectorum RCEF 264]